MSDISLACRQIGPIRFKAKFEQGEDVFRKRRSLFFKKMQIVRGCDAKRNVLVYMVYSDRIIEGSPKNSTSSVPIMPWGRAIRSRSARTSSRSSGQGDSCGTWSALNAFDFSGHGLRTGSLQCRHTYGAQVMLFRDHARVGIRSSPFYILRCNGL